MAETPQQADAIQQQMRQIRAELRADVQDFVAGAREMTDWTYYVRTYPWACLGAAAAIGFLIVPARTPSIQPDMKSLAELARQNQLVVKVDDAKPKRGLLAMLAGMVANSLLQGGLAIATQQFDQMLHAQRKHASSNGRGTKV